MLDKIIHFSLNNRLIVLAVAAIMMGVGAWQSLQLPIDVFPSSEPAACGGYHRSAGDGT